jgi:hypothetical protein
MRYCKNQGPYAIETNRRLDHNPTSAANRAAISYIVFYKISLSAKVEIA